jgi:hypothetical protein
VPHTIEATRGPVHGYHVVVLCPVCDADAPGAAGLITFFHVHGQVTASTVDEAAALLSAWAATLTVRTVTPQAWEDDYQAWLRGEL